MARKIFLLSLLGLFLFVCFPLITPLAMGAVFAVMMFPIQEWLEARKFPSALAAAVLTLGFSFLVLLPTATLVFFVAKGGLQQFKVLQQKAQALATAPGASDSFLEQFVNSPRMQELFERVSRWLPISVSEMVETAQDLAKVIGLKLGEVFGNILGLVPGALVALTIVMVSLYFFLLDGRRFPHFVRRNSFFPPEATQEILSSLENLCRAVVMASVFSGLAQMALMSLGLWIANVPNVALISFSVLVASFIPLVGSAPITFGVALFQLAQGNNGPGVTLLITAVIVGMADNFIRPAVLRGGANLHPLLGFVAAFGGLQMMGFTGLFLGPIIAGFFITALRVGTASTAK